MLMPKKVKFRKQQKGKRRGKAWRGSTLSFGEYGLKVMECGYITDRTRSKPPYCDDALHQARRQDLAAPVCRQAHHQEAC